MNWLKGLFIGAVAGWAAGMLFAPKSGRELREDIGSKTTDLSQKMKEQYDTAMDKGRSRYENLRRQWSRKEGEFQGSDPGEIGVPSPS